MSFITAVCHHNTMLNLAPRCSVPRPDMMITFTTTSVLPQTITWMLQPTEMAHMCIRDPSACVNCLNNRNKSVIFVRPYWTGRVDWGRIQTLQHGKQLQQLLVTFSSRGQERLGHLYLCKDQGGEDLFSFPSCACLPRKAMLPAWEYALQKQKQQTH